jgi:uncharacterized repeat protein (TIGR01451 family)
MKFKSYLTKTLLLLILLFSIADEGLAQTLDLSKSISNITTGGDGSTASQYDILEYTIVARNLSTSIITNARLYDNVPAGASYVAGSTTLNGVAVADAGSSMPYAGAGGVIKSPSYAPGVLAFNAPATIKFRVRITANGGTITNYATLEGTYDGRAIVQNTNTVFTNLTPDATCSVIYQSTASTRSGSAPYQYIRTLNASNGTGGATLFSGASGPCYNAVTGAPLSAGSVLVYTAAIAYDKTSNRIYFVNNNSSARQDLSYIDLNTSPVSAKRFVGYPLETTTGGGWNVNRMAFASDGFGYAITSNARDIIRFSIDPGTGLPVISRLGSLINDANNGFNDILSEAGGDVFGDGSGNLYLVANSSNLYKINPNTRVATFLGSVNPFPGTSNSIAIDATGRVYIGGAYQNVYTVNLTTMAATSITGGSTSDVWTNGDYTSCAFPVLAPNLAANKTYNNISGHPVVIAGDTVEYTITVVNTGNINAAGVRLYDSIPGATTYIAGSTRLNGAPVADVAGTMPFAVAGGRLINSPGEQGGIIKPGETNKAVVTFRARAGALQRICNQSRITLLDAEGNTIFINSDDPSETGSQNSTCFFSDGVLPLRNLAFTGSMTSKGAFLQWSMAAEQNISYYEVEYAGDGTNFIPLGKVPASKLNGYSFTDKVHNAAAIRYYRLKMVQTGGSHSYSRIIRLGMYGMDVQVQPNPFSKEINVQFPLKTAETVQIRLLDMHGRVIATITKTLPAGHHSTSLETPARLSAGMYVLEVVAGQHRLYQQKLIKHF